MVDDGLYAALVRRGMSRRSFLRFSAAMAAALALPAAYAPRIAEALTKAPRLPIIWLRGQECAGETEAFLRAPDPSAASLLLDLLSIEYHETLMAPAGTTAAQAISNAMARYPNGYVAVIEGSIPTAAGGAYCLVGGRPFIDVAREVADGALAVIAAGGCAVDGGIQAAGAGLFGGPTGAKGVHDAIGGRALIALPGCPLNVENLVATIVHYLTFGTWPSTDAVGRPLFAYGSLIHNECERRPHFEFGEFVQAWGDEGAQKGWCLYKMGCKGPESFGNCATKRFAGGTSWPVRAGHGCVGCTMPGFWDAMTPFYKRLGTPVPPLPNLTVDMVGAALVGGVGGLAVMHAAGMTVKFKRQGRQARRAAETAAEAPEAPEGNAAAVAVMDRPAEAEEPVTPVDTEPLAPLAPWPVIPPPDAGSADAPGPEVR
jgi:hydrogenase small subunit